MRALSPASLSFEVGNETAGGASFPELANLLSTLLQDTQCAGNTPASSFGQVRDPKGASIIGKLNRRVRGCEASVDEQNASRNPRSDKAARRAGRKGPFQETSSTRLPHLPAAATWAMLSSRHKGPLSRRRLKF